MKAIMLLLLASTCSFANAQTIATGDLTVKQQLDNLNSCWKGKHLDAQVLNEKIPLRGDVSLIQMHLSLVEKTLREKDASHLSIQQKENRNHCLDILHDYRLNGVFPINTHHKARTPYFIDNFGTACAVGQLIIETGNESVAKKIHDENNYAYIKELNEQYPELQLWAEANGFEMDELAWIQPGYGPPCNCPGLNPCAPGTYSDISCYGMNDGCIGMPIMVSDTNWVPPYTYSTDPDCFGCLPPGVYGFVITDAVGHSRNYSYILSEPDSLSLTISSTDDPGSCHGSALASVSGGTPPYAYLWSRGDTTQQLDDACFGTYHCSVTDANACSKTASIIVASLPAPSTVVTHGPIIGGVTDVSANVFVRTAEAGTITVELSTDNFSTIAKAVSGLTIATRDSSRILNITGLSPKTRYAVRVMIDGQESGSRSSFKTFPAVGEAGNYKYFFGSCLYDLEGSDTAMFARMKAEDGDAFIITGDWGYPDASTGTNDLYLSNPPKSWASDYGKVADSYKRRYASTNSGFLYHSIAMDYIYDDHDYLNDNTGRNSAATYAINFLDITKTTPTTVTQPPQARLNCIQGYQEFFPGYPLVDSTEGIFHNYRMGNVEFFVLDLRSARSPQHDALKEVNGKWVIQEPVGHSILGAIQEAWLLNALQNSTADWKIIVSSDPFNYGYGDVMDSLLRMGYDETDVLSFDLGGFTLQGTGILAAASMSDSWNGFRTSRQTLLDFVRNNNIKNVFIVSGDSHTVGLDDGTHSGIPELMAANLKKANSEEAIIFQNFIGHNLWNKGGSGFCTNNNFNSSYGKVEVFGSDSLRMSALDENGFEIAGTTFYHDAPYLFNPAETPNKYPVANDDAETVYNDRANTINVLANDSDPESDPLFVLVKQQPQAGTLTINNDQTFSYTPSSGYVGVDSFSYLACDYYYPDCPSCRETKVALNVTEPTGIGSLDASYGFSVYPNPAFSNIHVEAIHGNREQFLFTLSNTIGKEVMKENFSIKGEWNISNLPAGVYLFRILNGDNKPLREGKVSVTK